MTPRGVGWLLLPVVLAGATLARGEEPRSQVRATTTVEVLDDKAQIDDVISRLKQHPAEAGAQEAKNAPSGEVKVLKRERPALAEEAENAERGENLKGQKGAAWRRAHRERGGHSDRTERPRRRP